MTWYADIPKLRIIRPMRLERLDVPIPERFDVWCPPGCEPDPDERPHIVMTLDADEKQERRIRNAHDRGDWMRFWAKSVNESGCIEGRLQIDDVYETPGAKCAYADGAPRRVLTIVAIGECDSETRLVRL